MIKKIVIVLALILTINVFSENIITIPEIDVLLDYYNVTLQKGDSRQIVMTDRTNGVYLGKTYSSRNGDYKINDSNAYTDYSAYSNGKLLDIQVAPTATLQPYGLTYNFPDNIKTTFMLLQNENGVLISVSGDVMSEYSLIPSIINARKSEMISAEIIKNDNLALFTSTDEKNKMKYCAVLYDTAQYTPLISSSDENAPAEGLVKTGIYAGKYTSKGEVKLIILFSDNKENLLAQAKLYKGKYAELASRTKKFFYEMLSNCYVQTENQLFNKALGWSIISANTMINTKYSGMGIYAGFPWFQQNWGRDTFISLPGTSIVTGRFNEAKSILKTFSDYQHKEADKKMYGRIPNRVMDKSIIYNTTDGTPWMIREAYEYLQYTNDTEYAKAMFDVAKLAIEGAEKYFVDEYGMLTHADADTWMDAKIAGTQPWSPRGNRAVEIQALWFNQLYASAKLAQITGHNDLATEWFEKAEKVKTVFLEKFWNKKGSMLFDRITKEGKADKRIRPNQFMAITVPFSRFIPDENGALILKNAIPKLQLEYGVLSLDENDPYFHPFHENGMYNKDAAYHNGTIWGWNAGLSVNAMTEYSYQDFAFDFTLNLADQILNQGCIGSMSENMDAIPGKNGKVKLTGTYSQAWSVAEFARVFYQNYAGIKPELLENRITVKPKFPVKMGKTSVVQKAGNGFIYFVHTNGTYSIQTKELGTKQITFIFTDDSGNEYSSQFDAESDSVYTLKTVNSQYFCNDKELTVTKTKSSYKDLIGELKFAKMKKTSYPVLKKKDFLKEIILKGKYKL
ncbi:MAG: hypothetical protein A2015_04870 [Spirochaetes bacterium GWF1_31_7]|nr:MAG: hypothetical protein A2Y30_05250 [Spirochaetes bacterium GWE1_32_154]OHD48800.1 MAG: hypothetical protein A2Y29_03230 [Spirochaetes bacterium GWE2_31_10]OHD52863.1 MAG: hypothetical protein A2015_04870 [Spirochaetes bacterium GWF1_31_7]OHD77220.1 MAG: hypothetical protein A2355_08810 [Spirochaetes bacterium RIFOXYB1_FULL_32_8]HBD93149.1 hypothetical protein [Spirochaetia bacterium]